MRYMKEILRKNKTWVLAYLSIGIFNAFMANYKADCFQGIVDGLTQRTITIYGILLYGAVLVLNYGMNYLDEYPTAKLANEIYWTPYARQVYENAFAVVPEDSLGKAVNFYIRLNMGHGFRTNGEKVGWKNDVQGRERAYASQDWCHLPDKIMQAAKRLRGVQIEHRPAVEVIQRFNFPNVLIYADPPYVLETRHGKQYRCEMDDVDHAELLDMLESHSGRVLISGYDNSLYNNRLRDWHREETICYSQVSSKRREVLWMNFKPERQMSLFD